MHAERAGAHGFPEYRCLISIASGSTSCGRCGRRLVPSGLLVICVRR